MELSFLMQLEECAIVRCYREQPVEIPYEFDGKTRSYCPDALFVLQDERAVVVEIKPVFQMGLRQNLVKWSALRGFCSKKGWGVLITDCRKTIQDVQHHDVDQRFAQTALARLETSAMDWAEYRELRDCYGVDRNEFLALILQKRLEWRLSPFRLERTNAHNPV